MGDCVYIEKKNWSTSPIGHAYTYKDSETRKDITEILFRFIKNKTTRPKSGYPQAKNKGNSM
jgi:hypothetical protein